MSVGAECDAVCAAEVTCAVCGRTKSPRGRDCRDNGRCGVDCAGYRQPPAPGHLWPSEWRAHERGDHRACNDCGQETVRCATCGEVVTECECAREQP